MHDVLWFHPVAEIREVRSKIDPPVGDAMAGGALRREKEYRLATMRIKSGRRISSAVTARPPTVQRV